MPLCSRLHGVLLSFALSTFLVACASTNVSNAPADSVKNDSKQAQSQKPIQEPAKRIIKPLKEARKWVLLPLINETNSFNASANVTAIVQKYLRERNVVSDVLVPTQFDAKGFQYIVTGRVITWRSANSANPRPEVRIALQAFDLQARRVLWRDETARVGQAGDSLLQVGNEVIRGLVTRISIDE